MIVDDHGIEEKGDLIIVVTVHAYDTYTIHSSCSAFVVEHHRATLERRVSCSTEPPKTYKTRLHMPNS